VLKNEVRHQEEENYKVMLPRKWAREEIARESRQGTKPLLARRNSRQSPSSPSEEKARRMREKVTELGFSITESMYPESPSPKRQSPKRKSSSESKSSSNGSNPKKKSRRVSNEKANGTGRRRSSEEEKLKGHNLGPALDPPTTDRHQRKQRELGNNGTAGVLEVDNGVVLTFPMESLSPKKVRGEK
jgi:hypothetical protein